MSRITELDPHVIVKYIEGRIHFEGSKYIRVSSKELLALYGLDMSSRNTKLLHAALKQCMISYNLLWKSGGAWGKKYWFK